MWAELSGPKFHPAAARSNLRAFPGRPYVPNSAADRKRPEEAGPRGEGACVKRLLGGWFRNANFELHVECCTWYRGDVSGLDPLSGVSRRRGEGGVLEEVEKGSTDLGWGMKKTQYKRRGVWVSSWNGDLVRPRVAVGGCRVEVLFKELPFFTLIR